MINLAALSVALAAVLGQAPATSPNYEHLKEYGETSTGEWKGEFKVDEAIPGMVKIGDVVSFHAVTKWTLNKGALENSVEVMVNGVSVGMAKTLIGWDAAANEIVAVGFGSLGDRHQAVIRKEGERWIETRNGVGVDGKRFASMSVVTIADGGDLHIVQVTGRVSAKGEPLPNLTVEVKRVK